MKIECIISDKSIGVEKRCGICIDILNGDYNLSQKCYAICYLTYRTILKEYYTDKDLLIEKLDYYYNLEHTTTFENIRWKSSIITARIYLEGKITDCSWLNIIKSENLNTNPLSVINYLRLINLSIAYGINTYNSKLCIESYHKGIDLFKYFWTKLNIKDDNFLEPLLAVNQIKILTNLGQYFITNEKRKSFAEITEIEKTEPFYSTFKNCLLKLDN